MPLDYERARAYRPHGDEITREIRWLDLVKNPNTTVGDAIAFWRDNDLKHVKVGEEVPYEYICLPRPTMIVHMAPPTEVHFASFPTVPTITMPSYWTFEMKVRRLRFRWPRPLNVDRRIWIRTK